MRTAIFKGPGRPLSIETAPDPTPGPGQVVIRVGRCGICGSDVNLTGSEGPTFAPGARLGHEYAGEIAALGRDVTHLQVGDRVTALPVTSCGHCAACLAGDPYFCPACEYLMGGFSEYTLAEARYVEKLPPSLLLEDGALVEPLSCGRHSVRLARITQQSTALVIGAGPIGLATMYWARREGITKIVATARSTQRAALARTMGATAFVQEGDGLVAGLAEALGGPPDIVFECAGQPGTLSRAVELVRPRGTVVVGSLSFKPEAFVPGNAGMKQIRLHFSMGCDMSDFRATLAALGTGSVEPRAMVAETIGLDALPDMLELLRHDKSRCKVMVVPRD